MSEATGPAAVSGSSIRVGAPVTPFDAETLELVGYLVERIGQVSEAHLPMVYIPDVIDPPAISLVVVPTVEDVASLAEALQEGLKLILPPNSPTFVIPLQSGPLLDAARRTGTQIWPLP